MVEIVKGGEELPEGPGTGKEGFLSAIKTSSRTATFALALLVGGAGTASAEEKGVQVAQNVEIDPSIVGALPDKESQKKLINDVIVEREAGKKYYAPYIKKFKGYDFSSQYAIARLIDGENAEGGPDYPSDVIELIRDLRVPEALINAILDEAKGNGANEFFELPGFRETLDELRKNGNVGATSIGYVTEKAPDSTSQLYIFVSSNIANQRLLDAKRDLDNAKGELANAHETKKILGTAVDASRGK